MQNIKQSEDPKSVAAEVADYVSNVVEGFQSSPEMWGRSFPTNKRLPTGYFQS